MLINNAESSEPDDKGVRKGLACYQDDLAFTGETEAELSRKIKNLLPEPGKHPPIRLKDSSDEAIAALARALLAE